MPKQKLGESSLSQENDSSVLDQEGKVKSVSMVVTVLVIVLTVAGVALAVNFILKRSFDLSPTSTSRTGVTGVNVSPSPSPTPTPKPVIPIIKGKETYSVSSGKGSKGPLLRKVIVDPHDPSVDETQNFSIILAPDSHAKSIQVKIGLDDKKTMTQSLTLSKSSSEGDEWSGSWKLIDPHLYTYSFTIDALDEAGAKNHIVITIR